MSISSITSNALNAWGITPSTLSTGGALATIAASSSAGTTGATSAGTTSLLGSLAADIQAMLVQFQNDATGGTTTAASTAAADTSRWQTSQTGSATQTGEHHHHRHDGGGLEDLNSTTGDSATGAASTTSGTATSLSSLSQTLAADIEQALQGYTTTAATSPATSLVI